MTRHDARNTYPFHNEPRYDAERAARMAAAIAAHDARKRRAAMVNRLARLAIMCGAVALAVALFYSATN